MKGLLRKIPKTMEGDLVLRKENCRICNEAKGFRIGTSDYWDIKRSNFIKCPKCNNIQLDPMLNDAETSKGCFAYYIEEALRTNQKDQIKNYIRSFRRGVVFGHSLKRKKIHPTSVLEMGPGSGFFAAGIEFVFPDIEITVMDVTQDVLEFNALHHDFNTVLEIPDNYVAEFSEKFDLIIARDIIEHVSNISKVLENIFLYLKPCGFFHFITPNGHEDIWKHYLTFLFTESASELLINHVNYYDGKGLYDMLLQKGFKSIEYYTYGIKGTLRGKGWKKSKNLMSPVSIKKSADFFMERKKY